MKFFFGCPRSTGGWLKKMAPCAGLVFAVAFNVEALTVRAPDRYYTDFNDANIVDDFCLNALILNRNNESNGTTTYADIENNKLVLSSEWGRLAGAALIAGGGQWTTPEVVVGPGNALGEPYGVFSKAIATITYTFTTPSSTQIFDLHTNMVVMLQARKINSPYSTRNQAYFVRYDGVRFSLCEYTWDWQNKFREIAGEDVALTSNSSLIKMRISALGGTDGTFTGDNAFNYTQTNQTPAMLEAQLFVDGKPVAHLVGQDNPFDWVNGPEQPGAIFDPAADWTMGGWLYPDGFHADWRGDGFYGRAYNQDISEKGWTGVAYHQEVGTQAPNIPKVTVHTYEVVTTLIPPTLFMLR